MFLEIGVSLFEKIIFVVIAAAIELFKTYIIITANIKWDHGKKVLAVIFYLAYATAASISISSSFGFTLVTIDRLQHEATSVTNTDVISTNNDAAKLFDEQIKENKSQITDMQNGTKTMQKDFERRIQEAKDPNAAEDLRNQLSSKLSQSRSAIAKLQDANLKLIDKKTATVGKVQDLRVQDAQTVKGTSASTSMFRLIGSAIGLSEQSTMFIIMILVSLIVELGNVITSPHSMVIDIHFKRVPVPEPVPVPAPTPPPPEPLPEPKHEPVRVPKKRAPRQPKPELLVDTVSEPLVVEPVHVDPVVEEPAVIEEPVVEEPVVIEPTVPEAELLVEQEEVLREITSPPPIQIIRKPEPIQTPLGLTSMDIPLPEIVEKLPVIIEKQPVAISQEDEDSAKKPALVSYLNIIYSGLYHINGLLPIEQFAEQVKLDMKTATAIYTYLNHLGLIQRDPMRQTWVSRTTLEEAVQTVVERLIHRE